MKVWCSLPTLPFSTVVLATEDCHLLVVKEGHAAQRAAPSVVHVATNVPCWGGRGEGQSLQMVRIFVISDRDVLRCPGNSGQGGTKGSSGGCGWEQRYGVKEKCSVNQNSFSQELIFSLRHRRRQYLPSSNSWQSKE